MPGPLLPLVAAGIGAKLLLWNKRGVILKHVLRRQALAVIGEMETDRLRLYRSHRKDITGDSSAEYIGSHAMAKTSLLRVLAST